MWNKLKARYDALSAKVHVCPQSKLTMQKSGKLAARSITITSILSRLSCPVPVIRSCVSLMCLLHVSSLPVYVYLPACVITCSSLICYTCVQLASPPSCVYKATPLPHVLRQIFMLFMFHIPANLISLYFLMTIDSDCSSTLPFCLLPKLPCVPAVLVN